MKKFLDFHPCKSIDNITKLPCERLEGHEGFHTREIVWSDNTKEVSGK